jgi:hypothetical protein
LLGVSLSSRSSTCRCKNCSGNALRIFGASIC